MSSFAAGFFRSLERNSQAQLDAQREQMRLEAAKKLDLKYQRNKRIEKRGADWYEITTDGEGAEIPGLARKLNEAEVTKIKGDMATSNVAIAEADVVLDPEYQKLNKTESLDGLRYKGEQREMERAKHKDSLLTSASNRSYMGAMAGAAGRGRSGKKDGKDDDVIYAAMTAIESYLPKTEYESEQDWAIRAQEYQDRLIDEMVLAGATTPAQAKSILMKILAGTMQDAPTSPPGVGVLKKFQGQGGAAAPSLDKYIKG